MHKFLLKKGIRKVLQNMPQKKNRVDPQHRLNLSPKDQRLEQECQTKRGWSILCGSIILTSTQANKHWSGSIAAEIELSIGPMAKLDCFGTRKKFNAFTFSQAQTSLKDRAIRQFHLLQLTTSTIAAFQRTSKTKQVGTHQ